MKVYEIVKIGLPVLDVLQKSCINMGDCSYLGLYEEYDKLVREGCKKSMVVSFLAGKYYISERRVWYLVKKYGKECKIGA